MPKNNEICFSKYDDSGITGALCRATKKVIHLDCLSLLTYSIQQLTELRIKCEDASVILSMDLTTLPAKAFELPPDSVYFPTIYSAGHLFRELAHILGNSYYITMPYYEEEGIDIGLKQGFQKARSDSASFQLSRALLQFFLTKGFHLDNREILKKHKNWLHEAPKTPLEFAGKKPLSQHHQSNKIAINAVKDYFSNTTEAIVCLDTHLNSHIKDASAALYIGFNAQAFPADGDLTLMLERLMNLQTYHGTRNEWVIVLRGNQYQDAGARNAVHQEISAALTRLSHFGLLHLFLLTQDVANPLLNAYPDFSLPSGSPIWTPLLGETGYYLSDPQLFLNGLNTERAALKQGDTLRSYIEKSESLPLVALEVNRVVVVSEAADSAVLNPEENVDLQGSAPCISYVVQNQVQVGARQEQHAQQQVAVAQTLDQQQITSVQVQSRTTFSHQSASLFGMGIFHLGFDNFVVTLTESLTKLLAERREKQEKFKLYIALPEKADELWGLGDPASAAKKIASKLFGVGYQEQGRALIKTSSSIEYVDTAYYTVPAIVSQIEHYRDGYNFLSPVDNERGNSNFQWPMHVKGKNNELVVTNSYYKSQLDIESDFIYRFQPADLLSTLPIEMNTDEARRAYYHAFDGQVLSKKKSDYADRLMAVFLEELPCSTAEEQAACLNDYCALYREYDDSEVGLAIIRKLLENSQNLKATLKRLLYVHIKGGEPFVKSMIQLFEKLETQDLLNHFYKIYFEKSEYIFSLFTFLRLKINYGHDSERILDATERLFITLPAKKDWLPYHHFLAAYLLSFPLVSPRSLSTTPATFWTQIEALVQEYSKGSQEEQQKTIALIAANLSGEDGLRIQGGCHPEIVFRVITKILSSAGSHWTFNEQVEMLSDLPMAWCDGLHAIEKEGFLVICREMKLETAYLNPVREGAKLSNGYKVSRADFENSLNNPPRLDAPIPLETVLFRYLGTEISRQSLSYYRLLFKSLENYEDKALHARVIGWFAFYSTGPLYSDTARVKNLDVERHFSLQEKAQVSLLLKQLHEIQATAVNHGIQERYQLKSLLERAPNPGYDGLLPEARACLNTVIDKRYLNAFLQSQQRVLQTGGVGFGWISTAFIEEGLAEESFYTDNPQYIERQKRLLQTLLPSLNQDNWAACRGSIQSFVKDTTHFLKFFTGHASYKQAFEDALYQGLIQFTYDYAAFQTLVTVLLEGQHEARIDFSQLPLFFNSLSESNLILKQNKAILSRIAALTLKATPPTLQEIKGYVRLGMHLLSFSNTPDMQLFNAIVILSESTDAEGLLTLSLKLNPAYLSLAVSVFSLVKNHADTLNFLKRWVETQEIASLEEWISKLTLADSNQRIFIFEIMYALMQKEDRLDWMPWIQSLRDLPLAELSALAKLSANVQYSEADLKGFMQSHTAIETKNELERQRLQSVPAELFAPTAHTLEKINEIIFKPSAGHRATALEHRECEALWQDYLTLKSLVLDQTQAVFVEQLPDGSRKLRSMTELTEAEIQTLLVRIQAECADASTPSFRKHDLEILAIALASVALYRVTGRFPRDVQLLAVLNSMSRTGHVLHEIATGEGKGITTALHAILLWVRGDTADVPTINDKLAERDRKQFNPVYQYLGIPCMASTITPETDPESCQTRGIYYGTWSSFSLLQTNMGAKGIARPWRRSLSCDEVDAILLTTVEARLATSIDPVFQGKKKWENIYNYLLDFVAETAPPRTLAICRDYLARREQADKLKNPEHMSMPLINDALLLDLIRATVDAHNYQEGVDYSIVEKSRLTKNRKTKTYLYAAPILDSTKSPEASISWQWTQQILHTKLNRAANLRFRFKVEIHDENVMTVAARNFLYDYQKTGGTVYAFTGTAGSSPEVRQFFEQNKCVSFAHPRYAANRREDHEIEGADGKEPHFALILAKLKHFSQAFNDPIKGAPPFLSVFSSAKEVEEFYHYVQEHDEDFARLIQCYDGVDRSGRLSIENFIVRAGLPNTITLTTESLARGADIDAQHPEGLFTINCCTELTDSDLLQILGRSARAGHIGHTISLLDLSRLIPRQADETLEAWFARHRQQVAKKQSDLRELRKPLQEIRYAVASRLLHLKIELASVLRTQEGSFSTAESDTKFLKELNQLDQTIETEYYRLLKLKDPAIDDKLIAFAAERYERGLHSVLSDYNLDDYETLELPMPVAAIPNLKALDNVPLRDIAIVSDALSQLWTFAGNKAVCKGFEMADRGMAQLDAYFKNEASLQSLLLSQGFNMNLVTKEAVITQISEAQKQLGGWLKSISDFKILGHSMLFNEKEAKEIEDWANNYLNNIKIAIATERWDEIRPPHPEEGIVKKYIDRAKGLIPSGNGKGNTLLRFAIKRMIKPLIKKQNIPAEEMQKQLALLSTVEAVMMSVASASQNAYTLDSPIGLCLEGMQGLFKGAISDVAHQKDQPDIVKGLLSFLNEKDKLQNLFIGYALQALPGALALLNSRCNPEDLQAPPKTYAELSIREFFTPTVQFSFLKALVKLPAFLKIFEAYPNILAQINRLSEIQFSSFEKMNHLTLANNQLLNFIQLLSHPKFSSFLAVLPKDANWETMTTWLNLEGEEADALPMPIQTGVKALRAYEEERVSSQATSREKIRTLRTRFTVSVESLTKEIQTLRTPPPVPETLDAEPLSENPDIQARVMAPVMWGMKPRAPQAIPALTFPPISDWVKRGTLPTTFLSEAMSQIAQTGEVKPFIQNAVTQIATVIRDGKMPAGQCFNVIENTLAAIKQWQIIDAQDANKTDYLRILKPALIDCMKAYRSGSGKNRDRYQLIRILIKKAETLDTSEGLLELLLNIKQQLLEQDRKADDSFLHSILRWRRNSKGSSRLLDHLDNMIAGVTSVMAAEGRADIAEVRMEQANKNMLSSLILRKKIKAECKAQITTLVNKDPAISYHSPLVQAQHYLKSDIFSHKKHLNTFFSSFDRVERFRQEIQSEKSTDPRMEW